MPFYPELRRSYPDLNERRRVVQNILALRQALTDTVPDKTLDRNLIIGTWNLRDFGGHKLNPPPKSRLPESLYYIAEILSRFDLIALQEINDDMAEFSRLMRLMGRHWQYIATDTTAGREGNSERLVFLYDTRKVTFRNIAGEIVLPMDKTSPERQFVRTPFNVSFQSGWLKFDICTAHIYYGDADDSGAKMAQRVEEIRNLAKFLVKRARRTGTNQIVLGDFNIVNPEHQTAAALTASGFAIPKQIANFGTTIDKERFYDRIAFFSPFKSVQVSHGEKNAGAFDYYQTVFPDEAPYVDSDYAKEMGKKFNFGRWRTWQMSDHLPLWIVIDTDQTEQYLGALARGKDTGAVKASENADVRRLY